MLLVSTYYISTPYDPSDQTQSRSARGMEIMATLSSRLQRFCITSEHRPDALTITTYGVLVNRPLR
jgi:hypothetical protein